MAVSNQVSLTPLEQEQLEDSKLVEDLCNHKAWVEIIKPLLEDKINHSWVDPLKCKDKESFFYDYTIAFGFSKACNEILEMIKQLVDRGIYLEKKKSGEIKDNFKIGS